MQYFFRIYAQEQYIVTYMEEEDGVKNFWQARGRGGKDAREEEK